MVGLTRTRRAAAIAMVGRSHCATRDFCAFAALPLAAAFGAKAYILALFGRIMIFAIAAIALDLLIGYGGLISFGHAAFVGLGAYAVGILSAHGITDALIALPVALIASALFGLATGAVCLRTRGVYFIMITLAFSQMVFFTASSLAPYGGDDGLTVQSRNTIAGFALMRDEQSFYYVVFGFLVVSYLICRALIASRFGRVFRGARENAARVASLGYHVFRYQLVAYVIAGGFAGVSGFLLANATEFVSPAYMSWQRSGELVIMVLMGGVGTLYGAHPGRGRVRAGRGMALRPHRALEDDLRTVADPDRSVRARRPCWRRWPLVAGKAVSVPPLRLDALQKRFGGLLVTDNVSLEVRPGELHAIIGPNGAGKTTLINQISGVLQSDAGRIELAGRDVTALPMHARATLGLARSFQITSVLPRFSALENVALAVQARSGSSFRFFGRADREAELNDQAAVMLAEVGLAERMQVPAMHLAHGEKRVLELAIALAMRPKLLLLDEPMAGTGREETERLITVLRGLKGRFPIVLVEHDMAAVFALADRISVLIYGRILASGPPDVVRADPAVVAAYLGDEME